MCIRKKTFTYLSLIGLIGSAALLLCACADQESKAPAEDPEIRTETEQEDPKDKGYDLPIGDSEKEETERECIALMEQMQDIYAAADDGTDKAADMNAALPDETIRQMEDVISASGASVLGPGKYPAMKNHQAMEDFLADCSQEKAGQAVLYEISQDGGLRRKEYICDGADIELLSARAQWVQGAPVVTSISRTRLMEWRYTEKGWFIYELCVPEPPEVTEVVDGSCAIRVKPLDDTCRGLAEKYAQPLGYQGNNLLCSDWDAAHMEALDYNGVYEYLYRIKTGEDLRPADCPDGIPAEDFEAVVTEYLPVTADQIRQWAVFDQEHQTYKWTGLGCTTYALAYFSVSMPEVTAVRENDDGTLTLQVEAVCKKSGDDAALIHELTVKPEEDGSFMYLGNKILKSGREEIPAYQYRVK